MQQLVDWIRQAQALGYTREQARKALLDHGFSQDAVSEAFDSMDGGTRTAPAPLAPKPVKTLPQHHLYRLAAIFCLVVAAILAAWYFFG